MRISPVSARVSMWRALNSIIAEIFQANRKERRALMKSALRNNATLVQEGRIIRCPPKLDFAGEPGTV